MFFDSLLQPLESTTHVPTIAVAQELVDGVVVMRSRKRIPIGCGQLFSRVNNAKFDGEKSAFNTCLNRRFEAH